jgi:iron complex outermembrane recepter protein
MHPGNTKSHWLAIAALLVNFLTVGVRADTGTGNTDASAQSQAGVLNEIVVTAEKRSESVNSVPMSINALSGDQLTQLGIHSTDDLAKVVPGFSTVTSYYGTPVYYLRGVGYYDTSVAARPAVTIYADEAPIPYSVMAMGTTLDLERVEVLKGPQGTLFGSNSTGGAINFIAAKPTKTFEAGVDASYGRFNDTILSGFVSGPLLDTVTGRLAVSHEGAGDWQENYITGSRIGAKDISSARATLDVRPTEKFRALLTFSGTYDGSDVQGGQLVGKTGVPGILPSFAAFPLAPSNAQATAFGTIFPNGAQLKKNNTELQGTIRLDYDVNGELTLTSLTTMATTTLSYGQAGSGTTLQINSFDHVGNARSISQELRASGTFFDAKGHWVFGGNAERDKTYENTSFDGVDESTGNVFDSLGLPPINDVPTILSTNYHSAAVFGNLDFDLIDALTSHLGARYTNTKTSYDSCLEDAGNLSLGNGFVTTLNAVGSSIPPLVAGDCINFAPSANGTYALSHVNGSIDENSVSWRGGLDWKPIAGSMIYGNVSRGFKAAAVSNIAGFFASQFVPAPQEELTAYEIGVKTNIIPLTHINAAVFYDNYKDKQVQGTVDVLVFGPEETVVSIPKSNIKGADFDITVRPVAGLTLGLQGTYLKSDVEGSFVGTTQLGETANFGGSSFPNTPKWQTAVYSDYSWSIGNGLSAFVDARESYRSGTSGDFIPNPLFRIPSYALLDAYAGVKTDDGKWSFQLWGRNITDRYYWTSQNANVESVVRYAGLPVTYGISVSYRH